MAPTSSATVTVEPGDGERAVVTLVITPGRRKVIQVIYIRHGKIVHMQGVRSRREALALAGIANDAA